MGMNIIPSVFLQNMDHMDMKQIVAMFDYFTDDLPHPGSFEAQLQQWRVSYI